MIVMQFLYDAVIVLDPDQDSSYRVIDRAAVPVPASPPLTDRDPEAETFIASAAVEEPSISRRANISRL